MTDDNSTIARPVAFPGIIRWPCDKCDYYSTIRAQFYATYAFRHYLMVLVAAAPISFALTFMTYWIIGDSHEMPPLWYGLCVIAPVFPGCIIAYVIYSSLYYRIRNGQTLSGNNYFSPGIKHARSEFHKWRSDWLAFECASIKYVQYLRRECEVGDAEFDAFVRNSDMPAFIPRMYNTEEHPIRKITLSRPAESPQTISIMNEAGLTAASQILFHEVSRTLALLLPNPILGYTFLSGQYGLVSICMVTESLQFWTIFQLHRTGSTLTCRLRTGYCWWNNAGYSLLGDYYEGDVERARRLFTWQGVKDATIFPPIAIWCVIVYCWRQLRYGEFSRMFLVLSSPRFGDSMDHNLIASMRYDGFASGVTPNNHVISEVEALRASIVNALQDTIQKVVREPGRSLMFDQQFAGGRA